MRSRQPDQDSAHTPSKYLFLQKSLRVDRSHLVVVVGGGKNHRCASHVKPIRVEGGRWFIVKRRDDRRIATSDPQRHAPASGARSRRLPARAARRRRRSSAVQHRHRRRQARDRLARATARGHPIFLYFHSNGGSLRWSAEHFRSLTADASGLVALSYRGYGGSSGRPTETGLIEDAAAAYALPSRAIPPSALSCGANCSAPRSRWHCPRGCSQVTGGMRRRPEYWPTRWGLPPGGRIQGSDANSRHVRAWSRRCENCHGIEQPRAHLQKTCALH